MVANASAIQSFYATIGEFVLFYNLVATVLAGGHRVDRPGYFMAPTLIENTRELDSSELFGPITTLHRVSGFDEAVELANATLYGLTAAIWTRSSKSFRR